ncbi:hypothetical protein AB0I60_22855 [Actinosynnema sp. NPDC050436]|uniref:hypothetical protein n=1 Tax=Actinosynnema sp. NPDC050436 TaxID=3155659 RepID=UPI0033CDE9F0
MLGYRLFVEVDEDGGRVEKLVREQWHAWLRSKGYAADVLVPGGFLTLAEGVQGQLLELRDRNGARSIRTTLVEDRADERWTTRLTVHVRGDQRARPWLWLDVECSAARRPGIPRLARNLLQVLPGLDGTTRLDTGPRRVGRSDVGPVVESVCDPRRRGLLFVAAADEQIDLGGWTQYVEKLVKDTVGLAGAYVLDAEATREFNNAVGPMHAVAPWTVRTFRSGAEPDDPVDAGRHRTLGTGRILEDSDHRIAGMLGRRAREAVIEAPLPNHAIRVDRRFEQQVDQRLVAPLADTRPVPAPVTRSGTTPTDVPPGAVDRPHLPPGLLTAVEALRDVLGPDGCTAERVRDLTRAALVGRQREARDLEITERLRDYEEKVAELHEARDELRRQLEDSQLEQLVADEELDRSRSTVRHLQRLLSQTSRAAEAWSEPDHSALEERPQDYEALLDTFTTLDHVVFTGNRSQITGLDEHDRNGIWVGKIYDVLQALDDYATATLNGDCHTDVDGYLRKTPGTYRTYPAQRHARDESADVHKNAKYRTARVLRVPVEVAADGATFMGAHFKIAQNGMFSPRLHYYDDVKGSRKIYVGYIGRHLPTKRTN